MRHGGQLWLVPPEVWDSRLDDEEWIQLAEPVLMTEPLRIVSPGEESHEPAVVTDAHSIVGAWLPSNDVGEHAYAVAARPPDDYDYDYEQTPDEDVDAEQTLGDEAVEAASEQTLGNEADEAASERDVEPEAPDRHASHRATGATRTLEGQVREQLAAHNQLRDALARERELRDDIEAVELLSAAGRRVLGSVETLLENEDLWTKFAKAEREPLTPAESRQLERFNDAGLRGLLTGLGYREPPPVAELVDDTLAALALAHGSAAEARRHERQVAAARIHLIFFARRLRRLVSTSETQLPPSLARRVLRVADREGDAVMSAVAPVVLEALGELLFPGAGVAIKLSAAVGGVVSARLLAQRPRPGSPATPLVASDAREDLGHAFRELTQIATEGEGPFAGHLSVDEVIAQLWIIDEAIRLALQTDEDYGSTFALANALTHLRAARGAAMEGRPINEHVRRASEQIASAFGA
jgi:hypothetical protein